MWYNQISCKYNTNEPTCTMAESEMVPNSTNLQKWKQKATSNSQLRQNKETQIHLYSDTFAQAPLNDMNGDTTLSSKQL